MIEEIKKFLKDYEEENAQGGMPLMAEEIYIKHVKFLLLSLEKEKEENVGLRNMISEYQASCERWEEIVEREKERTDNLQEHSNKLGEFISGQTEVRIRLEEGMKELEGAIRQAQEENPDEKHCTCVPLLKIRIKELESQLASIKADESICKFEIVDGWNNEEEDIYTEQNGKKIKVEGNFGG